MGFISNPGSTNLSGLTIDQDLNMGSYDITMGAGKTVDGQDVGTIEQGHIRKKKTDTLKHSHDAGVQVSCDNATYQELKRITFTGGLKGAIRVKWTCTNDDNGPVVRGWSRLVDKDGAVIGTDGYDNGASNVTAHTRTEDIDACDFAPADYIIVEAKNHEVAGASLYINVTDFRIYYDENPEDFVNA